MIKDNQKYFNGLHVFLDAIAIAGSYIFAWYLKFEGPFVTEGAGALTMGFYMGALYFLVPGYLGLYYWFKLYTPKRSQTLEKEILDIIKVNSIGVAFFLMAITAFKIGHGNFSRILIFLFYIINVAVTLLFRIILRTSLRYFRKKGYNLKHILLVGYSRAAEEYISRIQANPQWGYVVRGILDNHVPAGTKYKGVKVIGTIENLEVVLPLSHLDEIAVTLALSDYDILEQIVSLCEKSGVHTKFIPDYYSLIPSHPYTEDLNGLSVINIRYVPLTNTVNRIAKRTVDIIGSACGLIILSPLLLILAILVKTSSKGPIIFKQERVGIHNKKFNMYKFRTMEVQTEEDEKKGWTVKNDPRVTKIGGIMRKTSMDELPQLWNILVGDMSLIGPRPIVDGEIEKYGKNKAKFLSVSPGLTGWWACNGRSCTTYEERIDLELYYVDNCSLWLDIKCIFLTVIRVLKREGAK